MPAPSVRASGTAVFGTASTLTPTGPANSIDDILLYWVASNSNNSTSPTHSTPSGYTLLGSVLSDAVGVQRTRFSCFWRRATAANETAPSVTLTPTGSTVCHHMAAVQSIQGAIASGTPYENAQTASTDGADTQAISRVISGINRLSFLAAHFGDNTPTAATEDRSETYVQNYATDNTTGIDGFTTVFSFGPLGTTNDTATISFTGGGTAVDIAAIAFAILPVVSDDRSGTGTTLSATGTYSTADGAKAVSATATGLTASGALGVSAGIKAVSATATGLTASGTLSVIVGAKNVAASASAVSATGIYSTVDGFATVGEDRSGTGTTLSASSSLGTIAGIKDVPGTGTTLSASSSLGTIAGIKDVPGTGVILSAIGTYSTADGFAAISSNREGTATDLLAAAILGAAFGTPDRVGTCADFSTFGIYSTVDGTAGQARSGTATDLFCGCVLAAASGSRPFIKGGFFPPSLSPVYPKYRRRKAS